MCVCQEYKELFDDAGTNPGDKTLEDKFFEHEVCVDFFKCLDYTLNCEFTSEAAFRIVHRLI